jgi:hypothetical protein
LERVDPLNANVVQLINVLKQAQNAVAMVQFSLLNYTIMDQVVMARANRTISLKLSNMLSDKRTHMTMTLCVPISVSVILPQDK